MAKNVLQKHWNGTGWDELHPVTKSSNVFASSGRTVAEQLIDIAISANDYPSISAAVAAAAINGGTVWSSGSAHTISANLTIPANVSLQFTNGAAWSVNSGITLTVNGYISAGPYQIFSGAGNVVYNALNVEAYPEWWGAKGDGTTNDSAAIQRAMAAAKVLQFRPVSYRIGSKVTIPQNKFLKLKGGGYRLTTFLVAASIIGFEYVRNSAVGGTVMEVDGIEFVEAGLGKTSYAISFAGVANYHDNWLRMYDCSIYGFNRGVYLTYAGHCFFSRCYGQANGAVYFLERDASFVNFTECMNLNNEYFLYADDPLANGISNGIMINGCHSTFARVADVYINGWDAVFIRGGTGFDLGGNGGTASLYLSKVTNFIVDGVYISPDNYGGVINAANKNCMQLVDCHSGSITGCMIVNAGQAGIRAEHSTAKSSAVSIRDNKFDGNGHNDIVAPGNFIGNVINGNKHLKQMARTGTDYEVYIVTNGSSHNSVKDNIFVGSSYTIAAGSSSVVADNIFGAPYIA